MTAPCSPTRLLGLEPEVQECIFDFYQAILEATIAQARREGRYDEGIVDVSGTSITLAEEPQVCFLHTPVHDFYCSCRVLRNPSTVNTWNTSHVRNASPFWGLVKLPAMC